MVKERNRILDSRVGFLIKVLEVIFGEGGKLSKFW